MRGYQLKIVLGGLLACALCNRAAAQQQFTADKVIAVVGNSMVLYSDLERLTQSLIDQQKETGYTSGRDPRCEALEHLIVQKVLYNQSQIDSIKIYNERIIDQKVQDRLNDETEKFGSLAALEMYYHKPIFDIRADMKRSAQEDSYAYEMENTVKNKVTVTPGEVENISNGSPRTVFRSSRNNTYTRRSSVILPQRKMPRCGRRNACSNCASGY